MSDAGIHFIGILSTFLFYCFVAGADLFFIYIHKTKESIKVKASGVWRSNVLFKYWILGAAYAGCVYITPPVALNALEGFYPILIILGMKRSFKVCCLLFLLQYYNDFLYLFLRSLGI